MVFQKFSRLMIPVFLCLYLLTAGGCGIPDYPYLSPPVISGFEGSYGSSAYFTNASDNNPSYFRGFVFYYRFFTSQDTLSTAVSSLSGIDDKDSLTEAGYTFLYGMSGSTGGVITSSPMVQIDLADRSSVFTLTLDFTPDLSPGTTDPEFLSTVTWLGETQYIGRYVKPEGSQSSIEKGFQSQHFAEGDSDLPSSFNLGGDLFLSVYVLSYGMDDDLSSLYSIPKELGRFELNTN